MKDILNAPFIAETVRTATQMYSHGWDERNGGNISVMLNDYEVAEYIDVTAVKRTVDAGFLYPQLAGKYFLVTRTGCYFKNIINRPERDLGIIRITPDGAKAELLWGFADNGSFTSEFPSHMAGHIARLGADKENRVIMHCHPQNIVAMTMVHTLDEKEFTKSLWRGLTECILFIPEGISVLPWMVCGTNEIGSATAEKLKSTRLVVWAMHGVYCAGKDLDDAFGIIETADKAAGIYLKTAHLPIKNFITDDNIKALAKRFDLDIKKEYLE